MEQRLIDANALKAIYEKWMSELDGMNPEHVDEGATIFSCVCQLGNAPTIDPETLPIVQELREENKKLNEMFRGTFACDLLDKINKVERELERVKAERDAAVRDLYIAKDCNTCALRFTDDCLLEECMDPCNSFAYGNVPYKWRGLKGDEQ